MRHRPGGEEGGGTLQLVIVLLITAGIILAVVRIVPVYVRDFEFKDAIREEAKMARIRRDEPPMAIRRRLFEKAQEVGLPVQPEQIQITPAGEGVRISVNYRVPVSLLVYTLNLNFDASADTATAF